MDLRRCLLVVAAVLALSGSPLPAAAQDPPPADHPASTLYRTATLLEADGEHALADALMDYILRRYPESEAAARIRAARTAPGARRLEDSGRTELVVWSTLYGLWLGVAVPGMFRADQPEPYGLGLLVGGPLGFGVSRALTADVSVTDGDAGLITWGGAWGTWQGFGWAHVLDLDTQRCQPGTIDFCSEDPSEQAVLGSMVVLGLAGTGAAAVIARRWEPTPGDATLVNLSSLWATWFAASTGVILEAEGDPFLAAVLLAGNAGAGIGARIARLHAVSRSDARLASIMGVAGGLAGAGIDLLLQPDDVKVAMAIPLATSILGLGLGISRVRTEGGVGAERDGTGGSAQPGDSGPDWRVGGGLVPVAEPGPRGQPRLALGLTLLSVRF